MSNQSVIKVNEEVFQRLKIISACSNKRIYELASEAINFWMLSNKDEIKKLFEDRK
jgi:hypothetical protein